MELRFSWFSLGSCWAVMTCGPEGAGGWRHGGHSGLGGRDKGGTWLGVGTGLVSPRRWAAPGWALGWGQCHAGAGMWVVLREIQGQHQCPQVAPGRAWGWCHPAGLQVAPTLAGGGDAHPDVQHEAAGALDVGAAQEGGLQHVATAPIAQEAPGVQVHLVARRLEVEGHCGDRDKDGDRGITLGAGPWGAGLGVPRGSGGSPSWQPAFHISWGL